MSLKIVSGRTGNTLNIIVARVALIWSREATRLQTKLKTGDFCIKKQKHDSSTITVGEEEEKEHL